MQIEDDFNKKPLEVKYGLPPNVEFCKKCVISNQRPSSIIEFILLKDVNERNDGGTTKPPNL